MSSTMEGSHKIPGIKRIMVHYLSDFDSDLARVSRTLPTTIRYESSVYTRHRSYVPIE